MNSSMARIEEDDFSEGEDVEVKDSDEEEEEEDEDEWEEHERPLKEPRKDAVYNTVGLHEKLEEIGWPEEAEWLDRLEITLPQIPVDVDDDLVREMSFYTQALDGAKDAYQRLQSLGIPFQRPTDYYAEMVKSDTHMLKIKDKLLHEKTKLEEMDERRKSRESKRFAKEVQAEKLKERAKRKKDDIESVRKWRKVRQKSGFAEGENEAPPINFDTGNVSNKRESGKFSGRGGSRGRQPSKGRQIRDSKYGYGGRKSDKRNTADSSADDSSFRSSVNGKSRGIKKGKARGGGSFRGRSGRRGRGSTRG